jgi:MFS family permease
MCSEAHVLFAGRRPLLLTGILLNGLCLMSVGVAGCFNTMAALYYIGYVMNFAQIFYAPTIGAVSWTISAEVSSVKARAKTQSLAIGTNALVSWAMNFIAPYLINTDEGKSLILAFSVISHTDEQYRQPISEARLRLYGWPSLL